MATIELNESEFLSRYPEFNNMTCEQLRGFFELACLLLDPTDGCIVSDESKRKVLLYLLTAHYGTLFTRGMGSVGAVSSASEGSVSVGYNVNTQQNALFFNQTQYGALYWQAILPYRTGRYITEC